MSKTKDIDSLKQKIEQKYDRTDYPIRVHEVGDSSGGSVKGHPDCE